MNNHKQAFLASNLTFLRENAHLTKGQLSVVIGTSISEIGHLECDYVSKPNYFILESIADYFGVDIRSLVREDLTKRSRVELRLKSAFQNLPEFTEDELYSCLLLCDDLVNRLSKRRYFDYRPRSIRPPPPRKR